MLRLERALDEGLERLKGRVQDLRPDVDVSESADDLDSIASSNVVPSPAHARGVRFGSTCREIAVLEKKLSKMEIENVKLRQEVEVLTNLLERFERTHSEEKKADEQGAGTASTILSEGDVFNLVTQIRKKS
jgi:hypothetical protein